MRALPWACALVLSGCVMHVTDPPAAPPKPASATAPEVAAKPETPPPAAEPVVMPVGKPGWKTIPQEQNGWWVGLDGLCPMLKVYPVGADVLVSYGGGPEHVYGSDRNRVGHATFMGVSDTGLRAVGDPDLAYPTGVMGTSLDDFIIADSVGTRTFGGAVVHRRRNGTWSKFEQNMTLVQPWVDGGVMGVFGMGAMRGEDIWVAGTKTAPPTGLYSGYMTPWFASFPTGEVMLVVGNYGEGFSGKPGTLHARSWSTATNKVTHTPLPMLGQAVRPSFVWGIAPDEIYAGNENIVAMYDGTAWKLIGKASKPILRWESKRVTKGVLWARLEDGTIEVSGPEGFKRLETPEKLLAFDGMDKGQTWAAGESGKLYLRDGETWTEKKLPLPVFSSGPVPFKAKGVVVKAKDDVVVTAAYWEKGPGWTEQELHWALLRTKKQDETLRCNEPDPENNNVYIGRGFQSWPPVVPNGTTECKTPFVMISRRSKQHPVAKTDWAKIKTALEGHADLIADGKLLEFVSGDRTFLGAKPKDLESAKQLVTLTAAKDRIRPEILCAEPPAAVRDVAIE